MEEPERHFYNDLSQREKDHWVSELRRHSAIALMTPLTYVAYRYHPVTYLYCENDEAIPLELQKKMVASSGLKFQIESCTAGHSPFLSQRETVLNVVEKMTG